MNSESWQEHFQPAIEQFLKAHIAEFYPGISKDSRNHQITLHKSDTHRFSLILEYDIFFDQQKHTRIFVKLYRSDKELPLTQSILTPEAKRLSQKEYEFHREVYEFFRSLQRAYQAVRPLAFQPEINALYLEGAPGSQLAVWLSHNDFQNDAELKERARYYFVQAGEMAREFHRHFRLPERLPFRAAEQMQDFLKQIEKLKRKRVEPRYLEKLTTRLERNVNHRDGKLIELAKVHGDYKLQHIFVDDKQLTLIDFGNNLGAASPFVDVAAFYVEIQTRPFATFRSRFRKLHGELLAAFLKGYFGERSDKPLPWLMEMKIIYYLLKKWNRRINRFTHNSSMKKLISLSDKTHLTRFIHYHYTNPWFMRQIEIHLRNLERWN